MNRDAGVTQGVLTHALYCSVQSSGVHERERENKAAACVFPRTSRLFLDPIIHARDMIPPESIETGGSLAVLARASDTQPLNIS